MFAINRGNLYIAYTHMHAYTHRRSRSYLFIRWLAVRITLINFYIDAIVAYLFIGTLILRLNRNAFCQIKDSLLNEMIGSFDKNLKGRFLYVFLHHICDCEL